MFLGAYTAYGFRGQKYIYFVFPAPDFSREGAGIAGGDRWRGSPVNRYNGKVRDRGKHLAVVAPKYP